MCEGTGGGVLPQPRICRPSMTLQLCLGLVTTFPMWTPNNAGLGLTVVPQLSLHLPNLPVPQRVVSYFPGTYGRAAELATQENLCHPVDFNYTFSKWVWTSGLGKAPTPAKFALLILFQHYGTLRVIFTFLYLCHHSLIILYIKLLLLGSSWCGTEG